MKKLALLTALLFCLISGINAQLTADFTFVGGDGCEPDTVAFTNASTGAVSYLWDFGDGMGTSILTDPSHTYQWNGTFVIVLKAYDAGGDSAIAVKTINVINNFLFPMMNISPMTACPGEKISFQDFGTNDVDSWSWDFGDGNTAASANATHAYGAPGLYTIKLTIVNSCATHIDSMWTVNISNTAAPSSFFNPSTNTVCPGKVVDFTNFNNNGLNTFAWDFNDGGTSTDVSPSYSFSLPGIYNVSLISSNACSSDTTVTPITVINTDVSSPSYSPMGPLTVCPGEDVNFSVTFPDGTVSYAWDFDDGTFSNQTSVTHSFTALGLHNVTFTALNRCDSSFVRTIKITVDTAKAPFGSFNNTPFSNICPGALVSFTDGTSGGVAWDWDFGDGDTAHSQNPQHTFASVGAYSVNMIVTNICGKKDTVTKLITITSPNTPAATFSMEPTSGIICNGGEVQFNQFQNDIVDVYWELGDGDTSHRKKFSHIYTGIDHYNVLCRVTNSCGITSYAADVVSTTNTWAPSASFWFNPSIACPMERIDFSPNSIDFSSRYSWDFGDGSDSMDPIVEHFYETGGEYTVTLIAFNSCGADTFSLIVTIKSGPIADFSAATVCLGSATSYIDGSLGSPAAYYWDFGDGDTSYTRSPSHTFSAIGTYSTKLTVHRNCCFNDTTKTVEVIDASSITAGYSFVVTGATVDFTDASVYAASWSWDFDDGNVSTLQNPSHIYAASGTYKVKLVVANACGTLDSIEKDVTILVGIDDNTRDLHSINIYPNPVRDLFTLSFVLKQPQNVDVSLHNLLGKKVYGYNEMQSSGSQEVLIDTKKIAPGVYFLKLIGGTADEGIIRKLIKIR